MTDKAMKTDQWRLLIIDQSPSNNFLQNGIKLHLLFLELKKPTKLKLMKYEFKRSIEAFCFVIHFGNSSFVWATISQTFRLIRNKSWLKKEGVFVNRINRLCGHTHKTNLNFNALSGCVCISLQNVKFTTKINMITNTNDLQLKCSC